MRQNKPTFRVKFLLFILFFMGIALTAFVIMDAEFFHILAKPPKSISPEKTGEKTQKTVKKTGASQEVSSTIDRLRQSILLIESRDCDNSTKGGTGTGFVVQADGGIRYIATNAHVIRNSVNCEGLSVFDYTGNRRQAKMVGIALSKDLHNDLAILKIENIDEGKLPPLELLNSSETEHDGASIITIGYPVLGLASTYDKASVSSEGRIAQYDSSKNYFITSGLSINKGNSGGPVFILDSYKVLGIAVAKARAQVAENVAMVIPINRFKDFFKEKTGRNLE